MQLAVSAAIDSVWAWPTLIIIEDLDRSSLTIAEIYNALAFRSRNKYSYLIAAGYRNEKQRGDFIEMALKLDGKLAFLPVSDIGLFGILNAIIESPPVRNDKWILAFSARSLIAVATKIKNNGVTETESELDLLFWTLFLRQLLNELDVADAGNLRFNHTGGLDTDNAWLNSDQRAAISSFLAAVDKDRFLKAYKETHGSGPSNWHQVFMYEVNRGEFAKRLGLKVIDSI